MHSIPSHSTTRPAAVPSAFSSLRMRTCLLASCAVPSLMLGAASIGVHAQTAHFAGAQSVIANAPDNGLNYPTSVAVDGSGNIYIADSETNRVLKETLSAGGYTQSVVADAKANGVDSPLGVAVDGSGNVYVVDWGNSQVLKETLSAGSYTQSVVANTANNGLESPTEVAVDSAGNV